MPHVNKHLLISSCDLKTPFFCPHARNSQPFPVNLPRHIGDGRTEGQQLRTCRKLEPFRAETPVTAPPSPGPHMCPPHQRSRRSGQHRYTNTEERGRAGGFGGDGQTFQRGN
ncbi:hypothetical protein MHYP_G00160510 [Metynnis hypsauchen]